MTIADIDPAETRHPNLRRTRSVDRRVLGQDRLGRPDAGIGRKRPWGATTCGRFRTDSRIPNVRRLTFVLFSVVTLAGCSGKTDATSECGAVCNQPDASSGGTGGTSAGGTSAGGTGAGGTGSGTGAGGTGAGGGSGGTGSGGAGTGGIGGTNPGGGGGTGLPPRIGRQCVTSAECLSPEMCLTANSTAFGGEGPAKGYCTFNCTNGGDAACMAIDPDSHCVQVDEVSAFCLEDCSPGPAGATQFDPDKCHGRMEVACSPLYDSTGSISVTACVPSCSTDQSCGAGLHCNPKTGLCTSAPVSGLPIGAACTSPLDGGVNQCAGQCNGYITAAGDQVYECSEHCTIGANTACDWLGPGTGPASAACLYSVASTGPTGIGDLGSCVKLCDCDSACNAAMRCLPLSSALETLYQRKGFCGAADGPGAGTLACDGG